MTWKNTYALSTTLLIVRYADLIIHLRATKYQRIGSIFRKGEGRDKNGRIKKTFTGVVDPAVDLVRYPTDLFEIFRGAGREWRQPVQQHVQHVVFGGHHHPFQVLRGGNLKKKKEKKTKTDQKQSK